MRRAVAGRGASCSHRAMELSVVPLALPVKDAWATSRGAVDSARVVVVRLCAGGAAGLGEASPIRRYAESVDTVRAFLAQVDAAQLSVDDLAGSAAYLERLAPGQGSAKAALSIALHDLAAQARGLPLYGFLGLPFREGQHRTSFSIGIASPDEVARKVRAASQYPILKLKLGSPDDRALFAAARAAAPGKWIRVDANEAWRDREQALAMITWLAEDGMVELVEQPMPADVSDTDAAWLRARSPLPLFADESFHGATDVGRCAIGFHGVNAKLGKTAGIAGAFEALTAARAAGLRTMLGCMVESSIGISAAAHLAELCDVLDLDGNLLLAADPYQGVACRDGVLSFAEAPLSTGLCVRER
jgi:L-alanine-DL-glutamate epimerase-like enolase superfamily enzyme